MSHQVTVDWNMSPEMAKTFEAMKRARPSPVYVIVDWVNGQPVYARAIQRIPSEDEVIHCQDKIEIKWKGPDHEVVDNIF